MAHNLYEKAGLEFKGHFDQAWMQAGLSELPGQLPSEFSAPVLKYYSEEAKFLHQILFKYYKQDKELFRRCLYPLLGMADANLLQLICFHGNKEQEKHLFKEISLMEMSDFDEELLDFYFEEIEGEKSSFELRFKTLTLQIRCKPMNKFTVPALKINCSMKKGRA